MKELINYIKETQITNLNTIEFGDIYRLLNSRKINYSACVVEIEDTSLVGSYLTHRIRISVVDKLNENENNVLDIFDNATRQLSSLINWIGIEYQVNEEYTINYIIQDFADKCAGVWTVIDITEPRYLCDYE